MSTSKWHQDCGLTEEEFALEEIVDKIKKSSTLDGVRLLQKYAALQPSTLPLIEKETDAIDFAEWMKENGWQSINLTMHDTKYTKTIWSSKWGEGQATSEQLYQLFKNKKQ